MPQMSSSTASRVVKMFVPRVVTLRSLREGKAIPLGGVAVIDFSAIKTLPKTPSPSYEECKRATAEKIGHICQEWEFSLDEESPSEWCPGCSYLCKKHSEDLLQKSFLESWLRGGVPLPQTPKVSVEEHDRRMKAERAASWNAWFQTLPSWDRKTLFNGEIAHTALKAGEEGPYALWKEQLMDARLLIKTGYHKQELSWVDRLDMSDPGWDTRITISEPREEVVYVPRPAKQAKQWRPAPVGSESAHASSESAHASSTLFGGASAQQWLRSQDRRPAEAKEREVEQWLSVKKNMRPVYTGAAPLRGVAHADSSSLLITGFGPEVGLWELRRLAALAGPVRDVYRPRSGNTVFVEMLEADGAQKAKALFAANPVEMGTRTLVFDVAQRNNTERYAPRR